MRSEGQIRHQLQQVLFRHLKKKLKQELSRDPPNCRHNLQSMDPNLGVSLCTHETQLGKVCDSRHGGVEQCQSCPLFELVKPKEEVKAEFKAITQSDRVSIAQQYPDVVALMWCLDGQDTEYQDLPPELEDEEIEDDLDLGVRAITALEWLRGRYAF